MSKSKKLKVSLSILVAVLSLTLTGCTLAEKLELTYLSTTVPTEPTTEITTSATTTTQQITESTTTPSTEPVSTTKLPEGAVKVWARQEVNIRQEPNNKSKRLCILYEGNGIIRIEKRSDGWSKVIYNGAEAYILSSCLTEKEPVKTVVSDRVIVNPDSDLWYLVVVDTKREIPFDYVPELEEIASSGKYLDSRVAPYYNKMYAAAKKDGIILTPYSAYRSYAQQQRNYNNLTNTYMSQYNLSKEDAAKKAATVILPPGTSEHNLGIAIDICNTNSSFKTQKEYKWLTEHAHEYGFILRYPAEKQSVTGIIPEPWHWRFVGVEHAEKIKDSGLCLEEYLQQEGIAY